VEVKSVFQEFKVFFRWVVEMTPSQVPDFQAVNHRPSPFLLSEYSVYIGAKFVSRRENSVFP
jgi:hypothetical protein